MTNQPRWPDSWYDNKDILKCPARGCDRRFYDTYPMSYRVRHWRSAVQLNPPKTLETATDHAILLLLNKQIYCHACDFKITTHSTSKLGDRHRVDVRDLFHHERAAHATSEMTTIDGFVRLVRKRCLKDLTMQAAAEPLVFRRLLQEIRKSEHYSVAFEVASNPFLPGGDTPRDKIASMLAFNAPPGEQEYWAISPEEFLMHAEHDLDDELHVGHNWKQAWDDLRAAYREGRI